MPALSHYSVRLLLGLQHHHDVVMKLQRIKHCGLEELVVVGLKDGDDRPESHFFDPAFLLPKVSE